MSTQRARPTNANVNVNPEQSTQVRDEEEDDDGDDDALWCASEAGHERSGEGDRGRPLVSKGMLTQTELDRKIAMEGAIKH